jgi:hypothetical protein
MAAKPDGETVCLALSEGHSRSFVLRERKIADPRLGAVGPSLTPEGSRIVAAAYGLRGKYVFYARSTEEGVIEIWAAPTREPDPHRNHLLWAAEGDEVVLAPRRDKHMLACAILDKRGMAPLLYVLALDGYQGAADVEITEMGRAWIAPQAWDNRGWLYAIEDIEGRWAPVRYSGDGGEMELLDVGGAPGHERVRPGDGIWVSPRGPWAVLRVPGNAPGALTGVRLPS